MLPRHPLPRVTDTALKEFNAASACELRAPSPVEPLPRERSTPRLRVLGLTPRTLHSLHRADVQSVRQLCTLSEHQLLLISGIGRGSIDAIRIALARQGLSLHGEDHARR
jgi:DNA-directed RNA polymerase alpha subunit